MTLAAARIELGKKLAPVLGKRWNIFPAPEALDTISKPTLLLVRTKIEPLPEAPTSWFQNTMTLWVIDPETRTEDTLDALLEDVIEALDESTKTRWTSAERDVWNATNPAYRILLTARSQRKAP